MLDAREFFVEVLSDVPLPEAAGREIEEMRRASFDHVEELAIPIYVGSDHARRVRNANLR